MGIVSYIKSKFKKKEEVPQYGKPMVTSQEVASGKVKDTSNVEVVSSSASVSSVSGKYRGSVKKEVKKISSGGGAVTQADYQIQGKQTPTTQTQSVVSVAEYTGTLPGRATLGWREAIGGTFSAIGNVGLIGQQGLGTYGSGVIGSFYAYPGRTKAELIDPSTKRGGTTYLPSGGTGIYDPLTKRYKKNIQVYQDPFYKGEQTYFEVSEGRKKDLWEGVGLEYTGQPIELIGQRVAEDVSKSTSRSIQTRIYAGEFGYGEESIKLGTEEFNKIASAEFEKRLSGIGSKKYETQLRYEQDLFKPLAVTRAEAGFKFAETGALIVASTFGGPGLTLATSAYLGAKTFKSGVEYSGAFDEMTTGQKVIGGGALVLGTGASIYGLKLGIDKYYAGWQKTIVEGLQGSKGMVIGKEYIQTTDDLGLQTTFVRADTFRTSGVNAEQLIRAGTSIYRTGDSSVGFMQKGITTTKVFSPRYDKFITTKETFSQAGNILNIQQNVAVRLFKEGKLFTSEPVFTGGIGSAKLIRGETVTDYKFIVSSRKEGDVYNIFGGGGSSLSRSNVVDLTKGGRVESTWIRSSPYDFGKIKSLPTQIVEDTSSFISSKGTGTPKTSFAQTFGKDFNIGVASQLSREVIKLTTPSFSSLISTGTKGGSLFVGGGVAILKTPQKADIKTEIVQQQQRVGFIEKSIQIPSSTIIPRINGGEGSRERVVVGLTPIFPRVEESQIITPAIKPRMAEGLKTSQRGGLSFVPFTPLTPTTIPPFTFGGNGGFGFSLPKIPLSFNSRFGAPFKTKRSFQYSPNLGSILSGYKAQKITGGIRRAELTGFTPRPVITRTRRKASKRKK